MTNGKEVPSPPQRKNNDTAGGISYGHRGLVTQESTICEQICFRK